MMKTEKNSSVNLELKKENNRTSVNKRRQRQANKTAPDSLKNSKKVTTDDDKLDEKMRSVSLVSNLSTETAVDESVEPHLEEPQLHLNDTFGSKWEKYLFDSFESKLFADIEVVVAVEGSEPVCHLAAHRLILNQSPFFAAKLAKHVTGPLVFITKSQNIWPEAFELCLRYFYSPKLALDCFEQVLAKAKTEDAALLAELSTEKLLRLSQPVDFLLSVYLAAQLFEVSELAETCASLLETELWSPRNIAPLAHLLDDPENSWKSLYSPLSDSWNEQLDAYLPEKLLLALEMTSDSSDLMYLLTHLPFDRLKQVLEGSKLHLRSAKNRFGFAKEVIARRAALRKSGSAISASIVPYEEHVLLAFSGSENGISIVRKIPKPQYQAATLYVHKCEEPSKLQHPLPPTPSAGAAHERSSPNLYQHFLGSSNASKSIFSPSGPREMTQPSQQHHHHQPAFAEVRNYKPHEPSSPGLAAPRGPMYAAPGPFPLPPHAPMYAQPHPMHPGAIPMYTAPNAPELNFPTFPQSPFSNKTVSSAPTSPKK